MATPEQLAQKLNQCLKTYGKVKGKPWKIHVRALLQKTFETLNFTPNSDPIALKNLVELLENEIAFAESPEPYVDNLIPPSLGAPASRLDQTTNSETLPLEKNKIPENLPQNDPKLEEKQISSSESKNTEDNDKQNCVQTTNTTEKQNLNKIDEQNKSNHTNSKNENELLGYFQIIRLRIHDAITLNAVKDPIRPIARAGRFSTKHADNICERVDKFLNVLSKKNEDTNPQDTYVGYRNDLLDKMPDKQLILRKKPKK